MKTKYVGAAATAAAAATTGPGRLLGVQILTVGSAAVSLYDSATTTSTAGLLLFTVIASATAGAFAPCGPDGYGIPFANGIWVASTTNTPEMLVVYSPNCPADGRPAN